MIPLHLKLSGFLSYRDPVEVDFTTFDLACISGPNGAGKSTLINLLTRFYEYDDGVITIDGVAIPDQSFIPVADSFFEVARVPITDGVHVIDGDTAKFSVVIVGYDQYDSYAYLGGTGTGVINPEPQ